MAVSKEGTKYAVRVIYKAAWDEEGSLGCDDYSQTFTQVKEDATPEQLKNFADALMSLTIYHNAPYKVELLEVSQLSAD